jgi:hypothetical protein
MWHAPHGCHVPATTTGKEMDMTDLDRLLAIEAIRLLKARALRAMDQKCWTDYEALHAPDHVSDTYGGEPAVGAKANTRRLAQVLEGITTVHHAHMAEITLTSDDSAEGIWSMEDMLFWKQGEADHWLHGYGHYHERYRKGPEGWQFVYRRLTRIRVDLSPGAEFGNLNVRTREAGDV